MLTASSSSRPPKGLGQESGSTELSGLASRIRAIERSNEDHGRTDAFAQELTSQVQARLVRKMNVEDQAGCSRCDLIASEDSSPVANDRTRNPAVPSTRSIAARMLVSSSTTTIVCAPCR